MHASKGWLCRQYHGRGARPLFCTQFPAPGRPQEEEARAACSRSSCSDKSCVFFLRCSGAGCRAQNNGWTPLPGTSGWPPPWLACKQLVLFTCAVWYEGWAREQVICGALAVDLGLAPAHAVTVANPVRGLGCLARSTPVVHIWGWWQELGRAALLELEMRPPDRDQVVMQVAVAYLSLFNQPIN